MAVAYNPQILPHGLVFSFDAANRKCISPLGCTGFNNAPQLVRNLMSPSDVINSYNGVKLGNLNYYTVFAIDYPESSYGGDAAYRHGITPGYNVRSGTKTFEYGRALNYAVYNNPTQSWVKATVYDTYAYASEVDRFVTEYATAVAAYPDAIHIVAGSHRDSYHSTAQYNILRDLGAPSNVDSIIGFSSPEWILVGKPGLGAGNAYGWAFQNYSTNPDQVAHLNFGLPIYGNTGNYLQFDGSDDFITTSNTTIAGSQTFSVWMSVGTTTPNSPAGVLTQHNYSSTANFGINHINGNRLAASIGYTDGSREYDARYTAFTPTVDTIFNAVLVYNAGENKIYWYINGSLDSSYTLPATPKSTNYPICLGRWDAGYGAYYFNGKIYSATIHNTALTADQIKQNFNALKGRFTYEHMNYIASGNLTVTGNGTTSVNIFKTSGSSSWDNHAYSTTSFTAPCTIEFNKQAGSTDNGVSYAMIGWNEDPTADASYSSIDYASYPYRTDNYSVYNNGTQVLYGGTWNTASTFYIVYGTDGFIRHYNGSTLLYSVNYGTGRTVYVDSSFYSVNSTFGGFSNIRVIRSTWNGSSYV
jgi:hypothetical protein